MVDGINFLNGLTSKKLPSNNSYNDVQLNELLFKIDVQDKGKGLKVEHNLKDVFLKLQNNLIVDVDGEFSPTKQGKVGDCYLLSSISALASTPNGKKLLQNNIKQDKQGNYAVSLPGAKIAMLDFKKNGKHCYITGTYTVSKQEIADAKKSGKYSSGDDTVLLIELAYEKYRAEVLKTNKANGTSGRHNFAGQYSGAATEGSPLDGGQNQEAYFILTGRKPNVYRASKPVKNVGYEQIRTKNVSMSNQKIKDKDVDNNLDKMMDDPDRYASTAGFKLKMPNGKVSGHAFSIQKVTEDKVYLVNPWDSSQVKVMTREQFKESATSLTILDTERNQQGGMKISSNIINYYMKKIK